jgi:hypothetical protein
MLRVIFRTRLRLRSSLLLTLNCIVFARKAALKIVPDLVHGIVQLVEDKRQATALIRRRLAL